ncbi:MAG: WYL domain-containing protein [Corallococcus sp.]|nr:WYL domain-containing protein [Corallococcus sp.]
MYTVNMLSNLIKVRISNFVSLIIENDAQLWGFVKSDDTSNKNALLNKLIPNMLEIRKERRERIRDILENRYQRKNAEDIYECANMVIDEVYFRDEELDNLKDTVWIRPTKDSVAAFDEIESEELTISALDMSTYIRGLLNEYARLPQYKRQDVVFRKENLLISETYATDRVLRFWYEDERYKVFVFRQVYQYTLNQRNYIVAYDLERQEISSFFIEKIKDPYLLKKKFRPSFDLLEVLQDYCDNEEYDEYTVLSVKGNEDEE